MNHFEKTIKAHLDQRAKQDPQFATKYPGTNPAKTVSTCCKHIISEVKKSKRLAFADDEIYSIAIHFFDEDSVQPPTSIPACKVVCPGSLPTKDTPLKKQKPPKAAPKNTPRHPNTQMSIFDLI